MKRLVPGDFNRPFLGKLTVPIAFLLCPGACLPAQEAAPPIPPAAQVLLPDFDVPIYGRWLKGTQSQSGVALGGLGTGFLELRPDGRIHEASFQPGSLPAAEPRSIPPCRLTLTALPANKPLTTTLLSTAGDPHPSSLIPHPPLYSGHFPMADLDYGKPTDAPVSVWLRASGSFVPGEGDLSNLPVVFFSVRLKNEGTALLPVSLNFRWGNDIGAAATRGQTLFRSKEMVGVRLGSTAEKDSYALAVQGSGWGVTATPKLDPEAGPAEEISQSEVVVEALLKPGEEKRALFVFAWHVPVTKSDGKPLMNRYAGRFADAQAVALYALEQAAGIEKRIITWQSELYARDLPPWLKEGLVNSLYLLVRNSLWLDDGRLLLRDSTTARSESIACRVNASWPMVLLFPELEQQTLRNWAKAQAANGEIPAAFGGQGSGAGGWDTPLFGAQKPLASTVFALLCWRDFLATEDKALLRDLYPAVKRALQFAMTLDKDDNGLIDDAPAGEAGIPSNHYYDRWPWCGASAYTGGVGLVALRAGEEMAKEAGDKEFAAWCRSKLEKGQTAFEEDIWTGRFYRLYTDPDNFRQSDTSLTNQLFGQMLARLCELGELHPAKHVVESLRIVNRLNVHATGWGAVNGMRIDNTPDDSGGEQSREIWPSETWNFAATALFTGQKEQEAELRTFGLLAAEQAYNGLLQHGRLWNQSLLLHAKDGTPFGETHASANLSLWALALGYEGKSVRKSKGKAP